MTLLGAELAAAAEALEAVGVGFALVGGLAVSARAEPRFTRDADLAVAVRDDTEAEAVVRGLRQFGYAPLSTVEHEASGRLATVRLARHGDERSVVVDLLFASSGIEPEIVAAAEVLEILPSLQIPVATTGHLVALKLLAVTEDRPHDTADLHALAQVAEAKDWEVAEAAVALISERGYARDRDLAHALKRLRA